MRSAPVDVLVVLLGCAPQPVQELEHEGAARELLLREVAEEAGLIFHHFVGATGEFRLPEIMGAGVALLDYDLDGDLDVYLL